MSARKKWRIKKIPPFTHESAPSMAAAYRRVDALRQDYEAGMGRIHHVIVEVDEGHGWMRYEQIVFPEVTS